MAAAKYSRYYTFIKPVAESHFTKSVAPFIFSLLAIMIFTVFAIRPTVVTILQLQKEIENNQQVLNSLNEKARNLSEGKQNYDHLDPTVKQKIKTAVPNQPAIPLFISNLQNTAPSQGSASALQIQPLTLIDLTSVDQTKRELKDMDFSYSTQGNYTELLRILTELQQLPRLTRIDNVTISKQSLGTLTLTVSGKTFFIR